MSKASRQCTLSPASRTTPTSFRPEHSIAHWRRSSCRIEVCANNVNTHGRLDPIHLLRTRHERNDNLISAGRQEQMWTRTLNGHDIFLRSHLFECQHWPSLIRAVQCHDALTERRIEVQAD